MTEILIENGVNVAATLIITLIGVLGTWLTAKLAKKTQLSNINAAQQEIIIMAQQTVGELKQTMVDGLKAAHEDGKLTNDEIALLGKELLNKTKPKISAAAVSILTAACVDVDALIRGAAEDWIASLKE